MVPQHSIQSGRSLVLSYHGTLICFDTATHQLSHKAFIEIGPGCSQVLAQSLATSDSEESAIACEFQDPLGRVLRRFELIPIRNIRKIHLKAAGMFLAATAEGGIECNRATPNTWETFVLISEFEFLQLRFISTHRWVFSQSRRICNAISEIRFERAFQFSLGTEIVDLSEGFPILSHRNENPAFLRRRILNAKIELTSFTLLKNGWRIVDELRIVRPLIYYASSGPEEVFVQMYWSLASLSQWHGDVQIHVISDKPIEYVRKFVPECYRSSVTVQDAAPCDFIDYCLARYALDQYLEGTAFQPIIYMDADIAVNAPLDRLFEEVLFSDKMHAATERFSIWAENDSVGAYLFKEDEIETGKLCGFNAGCLAFPSSKELVEVSRIVNAIARAFIANRGRNALLFADQPVVNYAAQRLGFWEAKTMDSVMTVGTEDFVTHPPVESGLVHFWPARGVANKAAVMRAYVEHMLTRPIQKLTASASPTKS